MALSLQSSALRRTFEGDRINFETTLDLDPCTTIIGQPRGVNAIEFGLEMQSAGYNIYVLGASGTGRSSTIFRFVEEHAADKPVPKDWIYVKNFQTQHAPIAIELSPGEGCRLRDLMETVIERLRREIPATFDTQTFRDEVLLISQRVKAEQESLFNEFQKVAASRGAALFNTAEGFQIVPVANGQPLDAEGFAQLTDEQKASWRQVQNELEKGLTQIMFQSRELENSTRDQVNTLVQRVAASVVDVAIDEVARTFEPDEELDVFFEDTRNDILKNINHFRISPSDNPAPGQPAAIQQNIDDWFRRYEVNVIVDHLKTEHAPVIFENDPTVPRLLGRVEHEARPGGAVATDFTLLRGGALHRAIGGYLVLRAQDLFSSPGSYEALKRALLGNRVVPDDPAIRGGAATRTLDPEPIPLNLKVILIGPPALYYQLAGLDVDFDSIFKVMADFDMAIERDSENELAYATFVAARCEEEGLKPFRRAAVGKVIEYGSRLAGTQKKLSTRFGVVADLIRESSHWASKRQASQVDAEDVEKAIENRIYLRNRIESRMRESVMDNKQLIDTDGAKVGQINGLAVSQIGDHAFGHPSRLTTRTYVGETGVIAIDREVQMAGPIHNKGVMTLIGYLGGQYATDHPLSLSAQITFEQNYGGVDGDSASSTELYALMSSLSDTPIRQSIAVTGSVNQYGEVQAIGGVTEKVEGWYAVCKNGGLTGEQGAMVPASNVPDLMLNGEIVAAVEDGKFHVWAVETIDQGIEILTGVPAAEVHTKVKAKLKALADTMAKYENGS